MTWNLAPSLSNLRNEVNARWPDRSKASDGTIGDSAHSARVSDHNPNSRGSVNAIDITSRGINTGDLIAAAKRHPSVRYIIHDRTIMNRDIGSFRARRYSGSNPHTQHVHISIYQSAAAENNTTPWGLSDATASAASAPKTRPGTTAPKYPLPKGHWYGPESSDPRNHSGYWAKDRPGIKQFQTRLRNRGWSITPDGRFGPATKRVVLAFQKEKGLHVDGGVGPETWAAIWEEPIT